MRVQQFDCGHPVMVLMTMIGCLVSASCGSAPPPTFAYYGSGACGDVIAYALTASLREQFAVAIDLDRVTIQTGDAKVFDVASDQIDVHVDMYDEKPPSSYCIDREWGPPVRPHVWRAVSGKVTVKRSEFVPPEEAEFDHRYRIDITLDDLRFVGPHGEVSVAPRPIVLSGLGGWVPG